MKRAMAMLLAAIAVMVLPYAKGETNLAPREDGFSKEELDEAMTTLFFAAAGTDPAAEQEAREGITEEQALVRNAQQEAYRQAVLPWLKMSFLAEDSDMEAPNGTWVAHILPDTPKIQEAPADNAAEENGQRMTATVLPDEKTSADPASKWEALQEPMEMAFAALKTNAQGQKYVEMLERLGGTDWKECLKISQELCRAWCAGIQHAELTEVNSDYACWLYSAGMAIDYPIVQGEDNEQYLKRMFDGKRNSSGTLFIDYRNLPGFEDPNTLIYGHHMRNGSMFGELDAYAKQVFYAAHPYMLMVSEQEIAIVELFAGYTTSKTDHCYDIAISDEEDMRCFVDEAKRKSDFQTELDIQGNDRLITLSTCSYAFKNARYIVLGRINSICTLRKE